MTKRAIISLFCAATLLGACDYMPSWMGGKTPEIVRLPGERITVLPTTSEYPPDESVKAIPMALPPAVENADWAQHTGFTSASANLAAKGNFGSGETASAGDGEAFVHKLIARPVVGGGTVFAMDGEGKISAHDAANISNIRWVSKGVSQEDQSNANGGGMAFSEGKLYAVSGRGEVAAFDATSGAQLWRKSQPMPFRSAPKVAGGKLYAVTIDSQLLVFDATSGETLWDHRGIDETAGLMNSVSPSVAGDTVIVPYESGELYALSAIDGRELWNNSLALGKRTQASAIFTGVGGDPVIDGEVVFAVGSSGMLAVFSMVQGQRLWEKQVASINTPWVAGDYAFVLTTDDTLICFVKYDGRIRWSTKLPSFEDEEGKRRPIFWRGPVLVDGKLAIASSRGEMRMINAMDGTPASTVSIPDDVYTAPVVAGGRIYLITQSAKLASFQ